MTPTAEDKMRQAIIEQASAWQARHLSGELSPADKMEFLKWLRDNPHNIREYLLNAQIAKLMPQALAESSSSSNIKDGGARNVVPLTATFATRRQFPRFLRLATAAMLILGATYFGIQHYEARNALQVIVPHGGQRTLKLDDGSIVHMNSESEAHVRFSKKERLIELEQGQAMFTVAHDASRPFRVRVDNTEVLAVGTQFDVYRRGASDVTVTVVEGKVTVQDRTTPAKSVNLTAGEQIRLGALTKAHWVKAADVSTATAWVHRQIVFKGQPLGEVADEFNRYLSVPVRIEDAALMNTRISGIFSAYDEEAFIAFLKEFPGVRVDTADDAIRVSRVE